MKLSGSGGIGVVLAIKLAERNPVQNAGDVDDGSKEWRDEVGEKEEEKGWNDADVLIFDADDTGVCKDDAPGVAVAVALKCVAVPIIDVTLFNNAELVTMTGVEAVWITVTLFAAAVVVGKTISVICAVTLVDAWVLDVMASIGAFILMGMTMLPSDVSNETLVM